MRQLLLAATLAVPLFAVNPPKEAAPNFRAATLDREVFTKASLKGKVVLLQFWATWCRYCRADQPFVDEIAGTYSKDDLTVLAVNVGESRSTVTKYLAEHPRKCKIVLTEDTNLAAVFEAKSYPKYVLIDREGNIVDVQDGAGGLDALKDLLKKAGLK